MHSESKYKLFPYFAAFYCVSLVVSNVIAAKLYAAPFGMVLTAGIWLFPIVYIIGDIVPECYGLATARKLIWMGLLTNALAVAFFMIALALPYPPFWADQEAFVSVLMQTPRLLVASFLGYFLGTHSNAYVLVALKKLTGGKLLWVRTIGSTIVGEAVDSAAFVTIGFLGLVPGSVLVSMVFTAAAFKTVYEALVTPVTYAVIAWVKRVEVAA